MPKFESCQFSMYGEYPPCNYARIVGSGLPTHRIKPRDLHHHIHGLLPILPQEFSVLKSREYRHRLVKCRHTRCKVTQSHDNKQRTLRQNSLIFKLGYCNKLSILVLELFTTIHFVTTLLFLSLFGLCWEGVILGILAIWE